MLFCSTVVGLPLLIPPMLVTGELFKAWVSCWEVNNWKCFIFSHLTQWWIMHFTLSKRSYCFFVASIRLWRVSVWSHGHFYWLSFCPFPHSPLWCCHPCHGTFLLTSFFQVSFMSIYANISSYNEFHSIDCAFKIFYQLVVQSSVIGGRVFDFLLQLTLFNM